MGYEPFLREYLDEYVRITDTFYRGVRSRLAQRFEREALEDFMHTIEQPAPMSRFTMEGDEAVSVEEDAGWERVFFTEIDGMPRIRDVQYKCMCHSYEPGMCTVCYGEGELPDGTVCDACQGSGVCFICKGTGHLNFSTSEFPQDPFEGTGEKPAPSVPGLTGEDEEEVPVHSFVREILLALDSEIREYASSMYAFYRKHHDTSAHGYPYAEFIPSVLEDVEEAGEGRWHAYVSIFEEEYRLTVVRRSDSFLVERVDFPCACQEDPFFESGICECVEENGGLPDPECEYCYGSGVILCPVCYGEGWIPYHVYVDPPEKPNLALYFNAATRFLEDLEP